jgi:hypothetical protein
MSHETPFRPPAHPVRLGRDTVEAHLVATRAMGVDSPDLVQRLRDRVQYRAVVAMTKDEKTTRTFITGIMAVNNAERAEIIDIEVTNWIDRIRRSMDYTPGVTVEFWKALAHRCLALVAVARKEMESE